MANLTLASPSDTPPVAVKDRRFTWSYRRILIVLFLVTLPIINPIVHGDGVGYYAYARAALIQHNLNFEEDWRHANLNFVQSRTSANGQLLPQEFTETGHIDNLFTVGPAILWFPFLLLAHGSVLICNLLGAHIAPDGFSYPYLVAMAAGTAFYGFAGLLLGFSLARKYVSEKWAFLATLGIWFASSLPVYMYFNPAWSHAHSAFIVALFLWYWDRTYFERSTAQWIVLGLISGLMVDVYFPNGVFLLLPLFESLHRYFSYRTSGFRRIGGLFVQNLLFLCCFLLGIIPTLLTRKVIYGGFFRFGSYPHQAWDWSAPFWRLVLFSSDHGVLSWTPLLGVAILGLFFAPRQARRIAIFFGIAVAALFYVISSYPYWDGLSSFGNRFFISLTAIFVVGLAMFLEFLSLRFSSPRVSLFVLSAALACFSVWNLGFIFQWGAHLVPVRGPISWGEMVHNQFVVVPQELATQVRTYILRRHAFMRVIEQKDIEQLHKSTQP
jgi:hypothetical protein